MKKLFTILLLFISVTSYAQWSNVGTATLQRQPTAKGYFYRDNMGAKGFVNWYNVPQLDSLLNIRAIKDSTFNINKNFFDIQNASTARNNLGITILLAGKVDTATLANYALDNTVLHKVNNLSDVPNKPLAKVNLGIFEYLGEWNSGQAAASYYNRVGCLVSYNGVLYRIVSNPGTIAPRNWDPSHYAVADNPIGLNILKSFVLAGNDRYDFLTMSNLSTQQLTFRFNILVSDALSVDSTTAVEVQGYDFNLQKVFLITPNTWFQLNPTRYSTFNNTYGDTTSVKNRVIFIDFQFVPTDPLDPTKAGTFKFRYRVNNSLGLTGSIAIRNYAVSNSDLLPIANQYTGVDTPALYMNQVIQLDKGLVIASPNGTQYKITVSNGGTLTVTAL
jgi:hypothetical protein